MATDDIVYESLKRATAPLDRAWGKLRAAKRIAIKFNQDFKREILFKGQRRQLVSDSVARAVLRLLREETNAELICVDASFFVMYQNGNLDELTLIKHVLEEFDVPYLDGTKPPYKISEVPGGGAMFDSYGMIQGLVDADEVVSVAKMKNHVYMGVTGCLKNLFGIMPTALPSRPRHYYHHLVRMPYMLTDIGRMLDPALNIVDALVGQASYEWSEEEDTGRVVNTLIAGDNIIATDAVMTTIMGHNPQSDWLTEPFHRDRNPLLVAAESGFGTVNLEEIDYETEVQSQPEGTFYAKHRDSSGTVFTWRKTMCEQGLYYRDHSDEFISQYPNEFILLQDGEVKWHNPEGMLRVSRRNLAGRHRNHAMFLKYVDPEEREAEHFEVYEQNLKVINELESKNA
jgi:uncharacterized protein (DUF362 family)